MRRTTTRLFVLGVGAALLAAVAPAPQGARSASISGQESGLDFRVTNPHASYFDVAARMEMIRRTDDPLLVRLRNELSFGKSCRQLKSTPVLDGEVSLPSFHESPKEWSMVAEPLARFEETVSGLAGAWVASGDRYFADCLVDILESWARQDALVRFQFSSARPRSWYALESMIYSAALAYSTVSGQRDIRPEARQVIEKWLARIAQRHFSFHTEMRSCCDEHFYRRSLYMTVVGVVTGKDDLFRTGLRAIRVALGDLNEQGAFNLAVRRGWRAIHYQNDILLHLVLIMQVAHRQGYDLFGSRVNGRGFAYAVAFLLRSLESPHSVPTLPPGEQDLAFTDNARAFTWMEIWLSHFDDPAMAHFVRHYRPIGNPSAGGFTTLYFKRPESPRTALERDLYNWEVTRNVEAAFGARYPLLKRWKPLQ